MLSHSSTLIAALLESCPVVTGTSLANLLADKKLHSGIRRAHEGWPPHEESRGVLPAEVTPEEPAPRQPGYRYKMHE